MKKITFIIITVCAFFLFNTCALEIANVVGPDGGYVFYDKGSYTDGWRYVQCSPYDFGEIRNTSPESIRIAVTKCKDNKKDWYNYGWELPTDADMRKMLECFSYGLTRFSDEYYYLSVNRDGDNDYKDNIKDPDKWDSDSWTPIVYHKNFEEKANGEVERVTTVPAVNSQEFGFPIRIRAIRKF